MFIAKTDVQNLDRIYHFLILAYSGRLFYYNSNKYSDETPELVS